MGIFDFWKKKKLNKLILRLKDDFNEEIRDFGHFKELQVKKIDIIKKIMVVWNNKPEKAEGLVKKDIPSLIRKQLGFIGIDIGYVAEEDFILEYIIKIEERRNTLLGYYITQSINLENLEAIRNQSKRNIDKINQAVSKNSANLKEQCLTKLKENLNKQLHFLEGDSWSAINQNQEFLEYLNNEQALTQRVEDVIREIIGEVREIIGFESRQTAISRRQFSKRLSYAGAGLLWAFASSGKTAQAEKLIEEAVMPNKDLKKGEPKIYIRIFYGKHGTKEDAIIFSDELEKADVYIPELGGWNQEELSALHNVSFGKMTPEKYVNKFMPHSDYYFFRLAELQLLYNSRKYITLIDIPQNHPIIKHYAELELPDINFNKTFKENLLLYRRYYEEKSSLTKIRENFMFAQLQEFINTLRQNIKKNPKLFPREKIESGITILIFIGALHTRVSHYAQREITKSRKLATEPIFPSVSRKFASKPFFFYIDSEIIRRNLFGKNVSDGILAAKLFEELFQFAFSDNLSEIEENYQRLIVFRRKVIEKFSLDEIRNIFETIKKFGITSLELLQERQKEVIKNALLQKGIKLPQTPEEFTNMLPRYAR